MWNPPRPGIELMSPELAGRCLTTGPPGKSLVSDLEGHVGVWQVGKNKEHVQRDSWKAEWWKERWGSLQRNQVGRREN